jgi:hypothetical protein
VKLANLRWRHGCRSRVALRDGALYSLTREAVSLETPDGKTVPLPSIPEYREVNLSALKAREKVQRDSINYFPPNASRACSIQFFTDTDSRAMAWDQVELTDSARLNGSLPVAGRITYGALLTSSSRRASCRCRSDPHQEGTVLDKN